MSRISTHILDLSRGTPAAGVRVELHRLAEGLREAVAEAVTTVDGRTPAPLLSASDDPGGVFELVFHAGDYFRALGLPLTDPPFLDQVVIRFGVAAGVAYHVPLLLSPYGYSTYRGS
ncbi:MAG: hydroxyisourate hydrolase [Candidatus Solibacter sp.]